MKTLTLTYVAMLMLLGGLLLEALFVFPSLEFISRLTQLPYGSWQLLMIPIILIPLLIYAVYKLCVPKSKQHFILLLFVMLGFGVGLAVDSNCFPIHSRSLACDNGLLSLILSLWYTALLLTPATVIYLVIKGVAKLRSKRI